MMTLYRNNNQNFTSNSATMEMPRPGVGSKTSSSTENSPNFLTDPKDHENRVLINRIGKREIGLITRQLSTLLRAGLPLVSALSAMIEEFSGRPAALVIQDIHDQVKSGISMSRALVSYPKLFSDLYCRMVEAGEVSGTLEVVLAKLADSLEKRMRLAAAVQSALTYPVFMIVSAIGVVFFLMTFVVPSITNMFVEMDQALPWPTVALVYISSFMHDYWLIIALVVVVMVVGLRLVVRTDNGQRIWDRLCLKLPLFGGLLNRIEQARFARTLSLLLTSGISVLDGLAIVKSVIQNSDLAGRLATVYEDIARGETLAGALKRVHWLSPIMIHAIAIGELSGSLENQLNEMTAMVEDDIERQVKWMTTLLEPAVLVVMGLVVGFIVLAVLLPIFDIQQMF